MRSEKKMLDLIIKTARNDERIRAAWIEGSRCNPMAPKDIFQDYDIGFIVKDTKPFREDKTWIDQFGKRLYMQYPEENVYYAEESNPDSCYGWLMQFTDGVRLDLHVCTLEDKLPALVHDRMYRILLDKDNCLPELSIDEISDCEFWVKRPTEEMFLCTCNEFWWCLNNVAKGMWRLEIPYVMDMLNYCLRPQLLKLLEWKIGIQTNFTVSIGKSGKYMKRWLSENQYQRYLNTYSSVGQEELWSAIMTMCDLVDEIAVEVAEKLKFIYNQAEAENSRDYLLHVKHLPKDAAELY